MKFFLAGQGAQVFSAIVVVTVLGSLAAIIMSAPRVYFAMARDGLFIPAAASIHPRFGTPARAIALQALLASLLVVLGNFNQIVSYFVFVVVIFIALTVAALFVLRRKVSAQTTVSDSRLSRNSNHILAAGHPVTFPSGEQ